MRRLRGIRAGLEAGGELPGCRPARGGRPRPEYLAGPERPALLATFWHYTGAIDGQLGTNSWQAFQRNLTADWGYKGAIDGIVGSGTVMALQRLLTASWGYTGAIDGIAGIAGIARSGTQTAFKRFANGVQ